MKTSSDGHPISVVARRTGLSQDILRAWEKRYGAVVPLRTPTGRRLYCEEQVTRLRLLKQLVDGGRRISDVAELTGEQLLRLADEDVTEAVIGHRLSANGFLADCLDAVERLDRHDLEDVLDQAAVGLSRPRLRDEVLVPLIQALGQYWQEGTWRVVHEHVASAVLRAFLWGMWRRAEPGVGASSLVVATLSGQRHELGALLAAGVAADLGWRVVYLGSDLPAEEIAAALEASGASAVLLSLVYPVADPRLLEEIRRLRGLVDRTVTIVAGGRAVSGCHEELTIAKVVVVRDLEGLRGILGRIG